MTNKKTPYSKIFTTFISVETLDLSGHGQREMILEVQGHTSSSR